MIDLANKLRERFNTEASLNISLPATLLIAMFWSYGYQGALQTQYFTLQVFASLYLILIVGVLSYIGYKSNGRLDLKAKISYVDIAILTSIGIFLILILSDRLRQPIYGDPFYYAMQAEGHSIQLIRYASSFIPALHNFSFKTLIYLVNLIIFSSAIFIWWIFIKLRLELSIKIFLSCLAFLLLRYVSINYVGVESVHPPLQLFPLWLSTTLLSVSDLTLRLPQSIGLILLTSWIYLESKQQFGRFNSCIISIALSVIPLLLYTSTLVEGSIWTTVTWSIFIITLLTRDVLSLKNYFFLGTIIAIGTLLRVPSFLAGIFLLTYPILTITKQPKRRNQAIIFLGIPLLISLPFLAKSVIKGSPATYIAGESSFIPNDNSLLYRLLYAIKEGVVWETSISNIEIFWILLITGIFLRVRNQHFFLTRRLIVISFFFAGLAMFFSIRPGIWYAERYKAEYLIPFIISGGYLYFLKLNGIYLLKKFIPFFAICMIFYGITNYFNYPKNTIEASKLDVFKRQTEKIYDYRSAFAAGKNDGYASSTLYIATTYGVFPQILSGYTVGEVISNINIFKKHIYVNESSAINPNIVDQEHDIKLLLINEEYGKLITSFHDLGWIKWKQFSGKTENSTIYGLIRRNSP